MGLCLEIRNIQGKEGFLGKCFGYNDDIHLKSLDYLISINAFDNWQQYELDEEDIDYETMDTYFKQAQITSSIVLNSEQFNNFITLYTEDKKNIFKGDRTVYAAYKFNFDSILKLDKYILCWR